MLCLRYSPRRLHSLVLFQRSARQFSGYAQFPEDLQRPATVRRVETATHAGRVPSKAIPSEARRGEPFKHPLISEPISHWAGTFLARNPDALTTAALIEHLPVAPAKFQSRSAVLLITPKLVHLLDDSLVKAILDRLTQPAVVSDTEQATLHVVVAVVDQVPGSENEGLTGPAAGEGLSLLFSSSSPERAHQQQQHQHRELEEEDDANAQLLSNQPAVLTFSSMRGKFRKDAYVAKLATGGEQWVRGSGVRQLHLPLANTLFQNGKMSTLFEYYWRRRISNSARSLEETGYRALTKPKPLQSYQLDIFVSRAMMFAPKHPLVAVTTNRLVVSAMGNVLREINIGGQVVPASTELEPKVTELAGNGQVSFANDKALVFALVQTREQVQEAENASIDIDRIKEHLEKGARLYRVTGGGGGWGSKKGLLSLEAATGFDVDPKTQQGFLNNQDAIGDSEEIPPMMSRTGANIVKAGDFVSFWLSQRPLNSSHERTMYASHRLIGDSLKTTGAFQVLLGTVPAVEDTSLSETDPTLTNGRAEVQHIEDIFGGVSANGMSLSTRMANDTDDYKPTIFLNKDSSTLTTSSMFDVPNTRFQLPVGYRKVDAVAPVSELEAKVDKDSSSNDAQQDPQIAKYARKNMRNQNSFDLNSKEAVAEQDPRIRKHMRNPASDRLKTRHVNVNKRMDEGPVSSDRSHHSKSSASRGENPIRDKINAEPRSTNGKGTARKDKIAKHKFSRSNAIFNHPVPAPDEIMDLSSQGKI